MIGFQSPFLEIAFVPLHMTFERHLVIHSIVIIDTSPIAFQLSSVSFPSHFQEAFEDHK